MDLDLILKLETQRHMIEHSRPWQFQQILILKRTNKKTIQELLFEMVGLSWKGEEYILGYSPKNKEKI